MRNLPGAFLTAKGSESGPESTVWFLGMGEWITGTIVGD